MAEERERTTTGRTHRSDEARTEVDRPGERRTTATSEPAVDREHQREKFGGLNPGAAFFGWLVAIGVTALLTALLSATGAAIGLTELTDDEAESSAETISLIGGIALIIVLALGYYSGGYVAGRMSRFDGARQGIGVWAIGLIVTILLAAFGALAGAEYNVFADLDLPRIPVDEGSLATGGVITLALVVGATLLAAIAGGKVGERYHRRVDRAGLHNR